MVTLDPRDARARHRSSVNKEAAQAVTADVAMARGTAAKATGAKKRVAPPEPSAAQPPPQRLRTELPMVAQPAVAVMDGKTSALIERNQLVSFQVSPELFRITDGTF
jgi:hypothetical protein